MKYRLSWNLVFAISNNAGYLVSSVTDVFKAKGKNFAILDTAVNHLPECFEYENNSPEVDGHNPSNPYSFILAGATCLAGDIFGEYNFAKSLFPGDKIIFKKVGAYSLVRANKFNGIPLPKVFLDERRVSDNEFLNS